MKGSVGGTWRHLFEYLSRGGGGWYCGLSEGGDGISLVRKSYSSRKASGDCFSHQTAGSVEFSGCIHRGSTELWFWQGKLKRRMSVGEGLLCWFYCNFGESYPKPIEVNDTGFSSGQRFGSSRRHLKVGVCVWARYQSSDYLSGYQGLQSGASG